MTNNINKTINQIKLVKEKVNESKQIINILEYYTKRKREVPKAR